MSHIILSGTIFKDGNTKVKWQLLIGEVAGNRVICDGYPTLIGLIE